MKLGYRAIILGSFLFLGITSIALARDYYVSPTGNDSNPGTESQPWATIGKVNSIAFQAGDRILFEGNRTFSGALSFNQADVGSPTDPITITSYGSGRALISSGANTGLYIGNTAGLKVENINFIGDINLSTGKHGIQFLNNLAGNVQLDGITVNNVEVSFYGGFGLSVGGWNGTSGFRNIHITNVVSHDNGIGGINVFAYSPVASASSPYAHGNVYIGHCTVYNNTGVTGVSGSGEGIKISQVDTGTIERSLAYNNGASSPGGPVGIWAWDATNITIQFNESHHNKTGSAIDGDGFDLDGGVSNSVMQYNYSHDNYGAGYLLAQFSGAVRPFINNTIRYNISQNDGRKNSFGGIHLWNGGSGVKGSKIYNNTVYLSRTGLVAGTPAGIRFQSSVTNAKFFNNIVFTTGGLASIRADAGISTVRFENNNYWNGGVAPVINYGGATVVNEMSLDPGFLNSGGGSSIDNPDNLGALTAYQLSPSSPLVDMGRDLMALFGIAMGTQDYWGTAIPQNSQYDLGAIEFSTRPVIHNYYTRNQTIEYGQTADLVWFTSNNAGAVTLSPEVGPVPQNGVTSVSPPATTTYTLTATNAFGSVSQEILINVIPPPADTTPPTITITSPAPDTIVSGNVDIVANASDNIGVAQVEFFIDGISAGVDSTPPYQFSWNTLAVANGAHIIQARATDMAGNFTNTPNQNITVGNVPAAPSGLTATTTLRNSIQLRWTDNSNNETGFSVERAGSATGPFAEVQRLTAGATAYNNNNLPRRATYFYRVRAFSGDLYSTYTSVVEGKTR